jgi:sugar phosphate isomerase/epimerase
MADLPVVGAQLSVLDLDRHRDWLMEGPRDLEMPEFCLADILRAPDPFIDMARQKLDGWDGRLGIHGPFAGFELDLKDRDLRAVVQTRLDQALAVCERLGAMQMVIHSPYDQWDAANLDNGPRDRERRVSAILDTLKPAIARAADQGVMMVLENIKDVSPQDRLDVVRAANSPALRLSVDVGHAHWAHRVCGAPPADRFIAAAGELLGHVHLQDTDGYADRHWALGRGEMNFHAIFAALGRIKARPHLIIEINEFDRVRESAAHLSGLGVAR